MPLIGQEVDGYVIEKVLGEGAVATIYQVRDPIGDVRALKLLNRKGSYALQRMQREMRLHSGLHHENIVDVFDVVEVDERIGLVMEYVQGPDLAQWLKANRPSVDQAIEVFEGIVRGVQHAHERGLIHRDLKPANVLMAPVGERVVPKVADFGIAVLEGRGLDDTVLTKTGMALGTPAYMAPEQIRDAQRVTFKADLFALGALFYQLLTGERAFKGDDVLEVYQAVAAGERSAIPPELPRHIRELLDALLQVRPEDRPADCAEVLAALRGEVRLRRRWRVSGMLGATAVGALLVVGGLTLPRLTADTPAVAVKGPPSVPEVLPEPPVVRLAATRFFAGDVWAGGEVVPVDVDEVWLDRTEVSVAHYLDCVVQGGCTQVAWNDPTSEAASRQAYEGLTDPAQPIVGVTWEQARRFCAWRGGRLPTEDEWELAATWPEGAEVPTDKRPWPWGVSPPSCALSQFSECGDETVATEALPAGASPHGALHMAGNAAEWTGTAVESSHVVSETEKGKGLLGLGRKKTRERVVRTTQYVQRGGSFASDREGVRPTARVLAEPDQFSSEVGFRCAYDAALVQN